jgi:sugar lactone lactonase YvrE
MIRTFRISECPSCEGGKNGLVQWDPETGQVIINNMEQAGEWEVSEDNPLVSRFHGVCGAANEDDGETWYCEEPICLEVTRDEEGKIIKLDLECFHDDMVYVEYYELVDEETVLLATSKDHPLLVFKDGGMVSEPNPAGIKHDQEAN